MNNIIFDIQYLLKNKREWVIAILIGIASIAWLVYTGENGLNTFSNIGSVLESIGAIATLFIATSVLREERLKNLDKKLTVIFRFQGKEVMVCENAYLAGEADIRQWGQSIGQLMNNGSRLHFEPYIKETNDIRLHNRKQYKHYTAHFTLYELPASYIENYYQKNEYTIWICSLDNDSKEMVQKKHTELVDDGT